MSIFKSISEDINALWNSIKHAFSDDVEPFLKSTLDLLERNGGGLLLQIAVDVAPDLATMQFGTAVAKVLADLKAAGVQTIKEEEELAAQTALQFAKNAGLVLATAGVTNPQTANTAANSQEGTQDAATDTAAVIIPGDENAAASA